MDPCDLCPEYVIQQSRAEKFGAPLPWIGAYAAAASLVCFLAMASDTFNGFRNKNLWFPCKFFSLNAASLTLVAVAMKMPLDLSTSMPTSIDQLAKLSSTVLMTTIIGNFMPSIGSMDNKEIFTNITALGIFVITVIVNICIQLDTTVLLVVPEESVLMFCVLVLFVISAFSALIVPTTKKYIELKYTEANKIVSSGESTEEKGLTVEKLMEDVKKYWVMAETGNPQFVMARSVTCSASGAICLWTALILAQAEFRVFWRAPTNLLLGDSDYKWATMLIVVVQTAAVGVGTIAPAFRWFTAIKLKCSKERGTSSYKMEFKVENYWTERMVEWKNSPWALRIRNPKIRKHVEGVKNLILDFCIKVQILIVLAAKSALFISSFFPSLFLSFYHGCKKGLKSKLIAESNADKKVEESGTGKKLDLGRYVLLLQGEEELPERALKKIGGDADHLIQMGKTHKPNFLLELLKKSACFEGVQDFESDHVPSLNSQEPPNCWALPVVTLTCIAVAIPNVKKDTVDRLVRGVTEGLFYASVVEKVLNAKGELVKIKNAADMAWLEVGPDRKWQNEDLRKMALNGASSRQNLERLADLAKNTVMQFKNRENGGGPEKNPLNWPNKVIAANSMYRISKTILLDYEGSNEQTDEIVFEKLCAIIAAILGACLTNVPRVVTMKCFSSAIERREKSVREAARLLGETAEILKFLQQHQLFPNVDHVADINEWRAIIRQKCTSATMSTSNNDAAVAGSDEV